MAWLRKHRNWLFNLRIEAEQDVKDSKEHKRQVDSAQPKVNHMMARLDFYSRRNGFSDAFEEMIRSRGGTHAAGG